METEKVNLVSKARAHVNTLIAEGIDVDNGAPRYTFTKLNEINQLTLSARVSDN